MHNRLYLVIHQHQQHRNKLSGVFLEERAARQFIVPGIFSDTYDELIQRGGLVTMDISQVEFKKIQKSGIVYLAFSGNNRLGYCQPTHASPSKSGLVKKAKATDPYWTEFTLFHDTPEAGCFLLDGYPMPPGYQKQWWCSGPLIEKIPVFK